MHLLVQAGMARHPAERRWVEQGLPWGTKPRLILAHLNREALLNKPPSPEINVGTSLTAFVERIRGFEHGREIRSFKEQLTRLAVAHISLATDYAEDRVCQVNTRIVGAFDLWLAKDHRQRVLWPSTVVLSHEYFESLRRHAIPLSEEACAALAHSALALDASAWLAQRLCRIRPGRKQFITWAALKDQFGFGYNRMIDFKRSFRQSWSRCTANTAVPSSTSTAKA